VLADPDRLRGILLNLYTNAAKFTKRGHIGGQAGRQADPPAPTTPPRCTLLHCMASGGAPP
jgi:signal transduction histidine kinase